MSDLTRPPITRWDAGDLSCAGPLPTAFRCRVADLRPGATLEVTTRDPAARHDLPALARLMGHEVIDATNHPDGRTVITIRRR